MTTIFKLLKEDHERHRDLLEKISNTSGDSEERRTMFEQFRTEVTAHANAEEQSLYGTMLKDPDLQDEGRHSVAEHKEIDDFLGELQEIDMSSSAWLTKFKEMRHRYEHHIEEEEEDMFPEAKEELSDEQARKMGEKFADRKPVEVELAKESASGDDRE